MEKAVFESNKAEAKRSHREWVKAGKPKKFKFNAETGKRVMDTKDLRAELKEKAKDPMIKKLRKRYEKLKKK